MKSIAAILMLALAATLSLAKDKPQYEVGTFIESTQVSDGTYSSASCGGGGCNGSAYNAAHNQHAVSAPEGTYYIDAPVSVGWSMVASMGTNGNAPLIHKQWFMDDLHEGDKVLFSAECNKHNVCTIRMPNPDKPDKEFRTMGRFYPNVAKTNATSLCGKGKLTAAVEAQVCGAKQESQPEPEPAAQPIVEPVVEPAVVVASAPQSAVQKAVAPPIVQQAAPTVVQKAKEPATAIAPVMPAAAQPAAEGAKFETVSAVQPQPTGGESLGDAAKRIRQHKACLELARDNPSIICK
jgi:hypothetical protein